MNKKILFLSSALALSFSIAATDANAGFFDSLGKAVGKVKDEVKKDVKKVAGLADKVYKKLSKGAKKVYDKAKKVGGKLVVEAKHVKDFVKENGKKYGPKAFDAFYKGVKGAGDAGLKAAKIIKDNRELIEPFILKGIEVGGPAGTAIIGGIISEIPALGPVAGGIVEFGANEALNVTKGLIEADLKKQSGEKTEIAGYTAEG